jgi:probable HAF family extracellular repeat protein
MNDLGQVAGFTFMGQQLQKAFVYSQAEGMKDIGALGTGQFASAEGINNHGQVVGSSTTTPSFSTRSLHAFLYSDGQMYDLNELVVAGLGNARLGRALAINDNGQILAWGCRDATGTCQYYRLDPAPPAANYGGLWWGSPAGSESGWGVNITQQGDVVFATWFTYDTDGSGMWLVMSDGRKTAPDTYTGTLYRTTGPAFNTGPWDASRVALAPVGTATFAFSGRDDGLFTYRVGDVSQSKRITRQVFALPVPDCIGGAGEGVDRNYQALWWNSPAASESGWGLNITHQGDVLFATWFTYDSTGKAMWLVMPDMKKSTAPGTSDYSGPIYRTTGPAFSALPWAPARVTVTPAGTATLSFPSSGGWNLGRFSATVDGVTVAKPITRQVFSAPTTGCN